MRQSGNVRSWRAARLESLAREKQRLEYERALAQSTGICRRCCLTGDTREVGQATHRSTQAQDMLIGTRQASRSRPIYHIYTFAIPT